MGLRRHGRELALKALYQIELSGDRPEEALRMFFASFPAEEQAKDFAKELVAGVLRQRDVLDAHLEGAISNWSINRLSRIDHSILRMALFEFLELQDVPMRVTMDEAIELAKRYGDRNSSQFVNGVLDELAERLDLKGKGEDSAAHKHS